LGSWRARRPVRREATEIEPEPYHLDLLHRRDAELHQVIANLLRDRDEAGGVTREGALDLLEQARLALREVST